MKKRRKVVTWCLMFSMLLSILLSWNGLEEYHAATSYDNAMEFFQSTDNGVYKIFLKNLLLKY